MKLLNSKNSCKGERVGLRTPSSFLLLSSIWVTVNSTPICLKLRDMALSSEAVLPSRSLWLYCHGYSQNSRKHRPSKVCHSIHCCNIFVNPYEFNVSLLSAEEFSSASRSVKPGLVCSGIVSAWTWSATLMVSSLVVFQFGISGGWWYGVSGT